MADWQQTPTGYYPGQSGDKGYPVQEYQGAGGQYQHGKGQGGFPPPSYNSGGPGFVNPTIPVYSHYTEPENNMQSSNPEDPIMGGNFSFSEKSIRMAFIRKVYSILMIQLACTLAIGTLFIAHDATREYVFAHPGLWWIAFVIAFATLMLIACFVDARRKAPLNYIFLSVFTLAESFLVGCTVAVHKVDAVVWAVGICAVVCLGLTIFAFQTKVDFTVMGGALFAGVLILFVFGILLMFFPSKTAVLIYASIGAFIFSVYIIYDTQLMIGGDHQISISPEEYIFAALNLYIDIINLFLYILTIISSSKD